MLESSNIAKYILAPVMVAILAYSQLSQIKQLCMTFYWSRICAALLLLECTILFFTLEYLSLSGHSL